MNDNLVNTFNEIKKYHAFDGDGCRTISLPGLAIYLQTCIPTEKSKDDLTTWDALHRARPVIVKPELDAIEVYGYDPSKNPSLDNFPYRTTVYFKKSASLETDPYVINLRRTYDNAITNGTNLMEIYKSKVERNKTRLKNIFIFLLTIIIIIFIISFIMGI